MRVAIGEVLPLAIAAAISPFPIVGVVLMLVSPRGRVNAPLFVVGWLVGLAVVGAATLAVAGAAGASDAGEPATGVDVLQIVAGVALLAFAVRQWRKRPAPGTEPELPAWMGTVDSFGPLQAAGIGIAMSAVNPKNLLLTVAAATTIASTGLPGGDQAVAFVVYAVLASLGVVTPVVVALVLGERAAAPLEGAKTWLAHNNATILAVVFAVIGARVLGQGIAG